MNYPPIDYGLHNALGSIRGMNKDEHVKQLSRLYTDVQQYGKRYADSCPTLYDYLAEHIHDDPMDVNYVGTVDELSDDDPRMPTDPATLSRVKGFKKTYDI